MNIFLFSVALPVLPKVIEIDVAAQRLSLSNHLCGGELTYNLEIQSNFRSNGSTETALPINLTEELFFNMEPST